MTNRFLMTNLVRAMCSNAGFLFLSTLFRLVALQPHPSWAPHGQDPNSSIDMHDAAAKQRASEPAADTAAAHLGRMDAVILDSAPAPPHARLPGTQLFTARAATRHPSGHMTGYCIQSDLDKLMWSGTRRTVHFRNIQRLEMVVYIAFTQNPID